MSKADKVLEKVMSGRNDANISFDEICRMLMKLGYAVHPTKGSHVVFQKGTDFLNLQNNHGQAKAYQVRQIREQLKKN